MKTLLLLLPFLAFLCTRSAAADKPDVIYFMADDLGYADVGFNGGKDIPTPHLDQLAASGAVLQQYYVQHVCSPTRAALMTGRYPIRYGLQQGVIRPGDKYGLPLAERTLSLALREAGYTTAITGKWHLGEFDPAYLPTRRGFDIQYGHFFGALDYSTHMRGQQRDWYRNDQPSAEEGYTTRLLAKEASRIVTEQPKGKPLFLYVPFNAVHSPYHTAPGREKEFAQLPKARREYATMLSEMDTAIGGILAALDDAGRRERALIIFSSDNGGIGPADNGMLRGRKGTPYEGGHRVAACVSWKGRIKPGSTITEPLHVVDWFPTLAGIAGIPTDATHQPRPFDGRDILPVLTGSAKSPHESILIHHDEVSSAVRAGDWKLVKHYGKGNARKKSAAGTELFNLAADPGEKNNLATAEPKLLAELEAKLAAFVSGAIAPRSDPTGMGPKKTAKKQPNVLFLLCDDLRPDALGSYGSKHVKTPHLDALAARGVRFANAFCTTSLCSPSRASILTGLYAHRHGVRNNFTELPASLPHWPGRLRESGYTTAYMGKWHMGEDNDAPRPGFDTFITHKGQGKYFDTEWSVNGERRETPKGYYTTVVTDYALDWLKKQEAGKPWALCIGHKAPHSFYFPEEKYARTFDQVPVPYPASAFQLADKPEWITQRLDTWHGIYGPLFEWRKQFPDRRPEAMKDFSNMVRAYWGTVLSVDDSMGRLTAWLRESGQLDNTVIVFMGDNGLLEGEHGMVDKRTAHEPSIRIPILASGPGLPAGKVVDGQVLAMDTAPSILDLCGAPALEKIQGRSWKALANTGDPAWRTAWFYEYNYEKQFPYTPNIRALRTDEWKFIRYPHGDGSPDNHMAEMYHLKQDPAESKNLANDSAHAATRTKLEHQLTTLLAAEGLTPDKDTMPLDEGIKPQLPDQKIR
jgi:N-acetylglucosamine-6-sulfatase